MKKKKERKKNSIIKPSRRNFLKAAGASGVGLALPLYSPRAAMGAQVYSGTHYILVNAQGGWDPTFFCDPKTSTGSEYMRKDGDDRFGYGGVEGKNDDAPTIGDKQLFADISMTKISQGVDAYLAEGRTATDFLDKAHGYTNPAVLNGLVPHTEFFNAHRSRLRIINGIDTSTNNHRSGSRIMWSGLIDEGFPSLGAYLAASLSTTNGVDLPMAYLASGGFQYTAGVIPITRVSSRDVLARLKQPNVFTSGSTTSLYHDESVSEMIRQRSEARLNRLKSKQLIPHKETAISSLFLAQTANSGISDIVIPDESPQISQLHSSLGGLRSMMRQTDVILAAFQAGISIAANLSIGNFDTHDTHINRQVQRQIELFTGLDFLMKRIDATGLDVQVIVASDFGRTPAFNVGRGKDHWPITSMMMLGSKVKGGVTVGATDDGLLQVGVDPATLKAKPDGGVSITPAHVHAAIRRLSGTDTGPLATQYPLKDAANIDILKA